MGLGFAAGLVGLGFSGLKIYTSLATVYLHIIYHVEDAGMGGYLSSYLILDNSESPSFKFTFPGRTTHGM